MAVENASVTKLLDVIVDHLDIPKSYYEKAGDRENAMKTYKAIVDSKQVNIERALAYPEAKKKLKG